MGNFTLLGVALGLPHLVLWVGGATTGPPYGYTIASDLQTAG